MTCARNPSSWPRSNSPIFTPRRVPADLHRVNFGGPCTYQKTLRLREARRLMLSKMMDAGIASRNVGYTSASQFSREYPRYFGAPPAKDVNRLRGHAGAAAVE